MFDTDRFVAEIRETLADRSRQATREAVARAVADPGAIVAAFGEPTRAGVRMLHRSADLTILDIAWGPGQLTLPHDHRIWAVIGMYGGREDNVFWRRRPAADGPGIEIAGGQALGRSDVATLGKDVIHSVVNPLGKISAAIHVYGGDFPAVERSQWDNETLRECPFDRVHATESFKRVNELWGLNGPG